MVISTHRNKNRTILLKIIYLPFSTEIKRLKNSVMFFPSCSCTNQCSKQQNKNFKISSQVPTLTPHHDFTEKSAIFELKNITVSVYSLSKFEQAAVETARADLFHYWKAKQVQKLFRNLSKTHKVSSAF